MSGVYINMRNTDASSVPLGEDLLITAIPVGARDWQAVLFDGRSGQVVRTYPDTYRHSTPAIEAAVRFEKLKGRKC